MENKSAQIPAPTGRALVATKKQYLAALTRGDKLKLRQLLSAALQRGVHPQDLYLKVVVPCQADLGTLWHNGKISVCQEHLATQLSLGEMDYLRSIIPQKRARPFRAVITTAEGDTHLLGARIIADFLHFDGWQVDFLGADTPQQEFAKFVHDRKADLVGISVSVESALDSAKEMVAHLKRLPSRPKVLVGGIATKLDVDRAKQIPADAFAHDAVDAVRWANRLVGASSDSLELPTFLKEMGRRLLQNRKAKLMSQAELAKRSDLDRAYLSAVENGKQNITIGALLKLSNALEIPLTDLLLG